MSETTLLAPRDRAELTATLREMTPDARLLAGGTDLVREMTKEYLRPSLLVDLSGVGELHGVSVEGDLVRVGAMCTFAELQEDPMLLRYARCLAEAAGSVGSVQIRSVATVGGNVANASPCGDSIPALLALDAGVEVWDGSGATAVRPVADVVVGPGRTSLAADEVIAAFVFPALGDGWRTAFAKVGSRTAVTVARLSTAVAVQFAADEASFGEARVALGAVGETAFRDRLVEQALAGRRANASTAMAFAEACSAAVCRSIPGRYSLGYKCRAAVGVADDAWRRLGLASPADVTSV
jgi:CO/xanthine dehydrogenase FAD-binding subunit